MNLKTLEAVETRREKLVGELCGNVCRCGEVKTHRQPLCVRCYYLAPRVNRQRLYSPIGGGYEEAYQDAAEILDRKRGVAS